MGKGKKESWKVQKREGKPWERRGGMLVKRTPVKPGWKGHPP